MILQCRFINSTKCITLVRVCVHVWGQETWELSGLPAQFCCEHKKVPSFGHYGSFEDDENTLYIDMVTWKYTFTKWF